MGNRKDFQLEAKLFKLKLKQRRNVLGLGERIRGREKRWENVPSTGKAVDMKCLRREGTQCVGPF